MKQIIVEGVSPIKLVLSPIEVTLAAKIIAKKKVFVDSYNVSEILRYFADMNKEL